MKWRVYILLLGNGQYYVGSTSNLEGRIAQHKAWKVIATKGKLPLELLFTREYETLPEARSLAIFIALNQQGETEIFSDKKKFRAFYQNKHYVKADDDARPQSKNKGKNNQAPLF